VACWAGEGGCEEGAFEERMVRMWESKGSWRAWHAAAVGDIEVIQVYLRMVDSLDIYEDMARFI